MATLDLAAADVRWCRFDHSPVTSQSVGVGGRSSENEQSKTGAPDERTRPGLGLGSQWLPMPALVPSPNSPRMEDGSLPRLMLLLTLRQPVHWTLALAARSFGLLRGLALRKYPGTAVHLPVLSLLVRAVPI